MRSWKPEIGLFCLVAAVIGLLVAVKDAVLRIEPADVTFDCFLTDFFICWRDPFVKFSRGYTPSMNSLLLNLASASKSSLLMIAMSRASFA